jgi:putative ATP-binding cassette transporter
VIQAENQAEAELRAAANHIREIGEATPPAMAEPEDHRSLCRALRQTLLRWRQLCRQLMGTAMVSQTDVCWHPYLRGCSVRPSFSPGA